MTASFSWYARKIVAVGLVVSLAMGFSLGQAQDAAVLALGAGDVHKAVVLVTKPGEVMLEVTYSKAKQAEFLKASQTGLPKSFSIAFNGQVVGQRTIMQPLTGHSIKIPMTSVDAAFAQALAVMPSLKGAAPAGGSAAAPGGGPAFAVSSSAVAKFAVFMYLPGTVWIDLTLGDKEKAEIAQLSAKNAGGKVPCLLDGKPIGLVELPAGSPGPTARIDLANVDAAIAVAKAILGPGGKVE